MDNSELVDALCKASVRLREARRMHIRDYGILLPHVFMGEVLKRVGHCLALVATHDLDAYASELAEILEMLERGMAEGDRETRDVVAFSFARDSETERFFGELVPLLGPRTRAQLSER